MKTYQGWSGEHSVHAKQIKFSIGNKLNSVLVISLNHRIE